MQLVTQDYETLADYAVDEFFRAKTPLNTSLLKVAEENELNTEQIKRLVEMANTKTFLKMFGDPARKQGDGNVDFDVADSKPIIQQFYAGAPASPAPSVAAHKSPLDHEFGGFEDDMPDAMAAKRNPLPKPMVGEEEKVASVKIDKVGLAVQLRKIASGYVEDIYAEEQDYVALVEKTAHAMRLHGADFAEFEKKAYHLHGDDVALIVDDLLALANVKERASFDKTASYVVIEDSYTAALTKMYEHKQNQIKCAQVVRTARAKLKAIPA